ncbi:hypothetical protein PRIPAC_79702 [Pristionchus pacificus]|uniref:G protein-coupled receptor n=1 Tax=Pristionchus pacificus TaxID=54126 RepID=A0A2A6CQT2_PRIPA|nr:hypothetical protein PRIPAC_79702 [Pristionchus pacificus]|eukprot:PDM80417.1 G protein-coupled receptor [Pristionchus pacificus]
MPTDHHCRFEPPQSTERSFAVEDTVGRCKISENFRIFAFLRPNVKYFMFVISSVGAIRFALFIRNLKNEPIHLIFEKMIKFLALQAALYHVIACSPCYRRLDYIRVADGKAKTPMEHNTIYDHFVARNNAKITRTLMEDPHNYQSMNDSYLPYQAQFLHDSLFYKSFPLGLLEMFTIAMFEYLCWLNRKRLNKTTYTLTERYQIAENIRMLEILRPIARFHGALSCYGAVSFVLFRRELENGPSYPIFEEYINFLVLQGIVLPIIFIRHERRERLRKVTQLKENNAISDDFVARYNAEITRGWYYLAYQARYLHDSYFYKSLISIKLLLGLIALPLLWKIRGYKRKVLAHESLSILMRFHFYYITIFVFFGTVDYSITIYKFQLRYPVFRNVCKFLLTISDPIDYIVSWMEMFIRRYPQVVTAHGNCVLQIELDMCYSGTMSSMFMMALERFAASRKFRTYESSRRNSIYLWTHVKKLTEVSHENLTTLRYEHLAAFQIALILTAVPLSIMSYDFGARYAVTTLVPEYGQIYHQIIGAPLGILEIFTIAMFEYLHRLNKNRLHKSTYNLSERYQIAENIRILEILRPIAKFHGALTCYGAVSFVLFGRDLDNGPNYPIFEECINFLVLQGIVLPIIFIRHERIERSRKVTQLEENCPINDDFLTRYNAQITRGKVLAHESLSILMRFHYYYISIFVLTSIVDYTLTIYKFQSR